MIIVITPIRVQYCSNLGDSRLLQISSSEKSPMNMSVVVAPAVVKHKVGRTTARNVPVVTYFYDRAGESFDREQLKHIPHFAGILEI